MNFIDVRPFRTPEIVSGIVEIYRQAFGNEPWNEGFTCPVCKALVSLVHPLLTCSSCASIGKAVLLVPCWPVGGVLSDFYREMQKPEALCIAAEDAGRLLGFAWGYWIAADANIDGYLEAPGLHALVSGDFFYLDEVAVTPERQRAGVGKMVVREIFERQSRKSILLRTLHESQMFRLIEHMGGRTVLHISRGRVIMALDL